MNIKLNGFIAIISGLFTQITAQYNILDYAILPNCTEVYSTVVPTYVPYTEVYSSRYLLYFWKQKVRTNYKLSNHTTYHEKTVCCEGYKEFSFTQCIPICSKRCGVNGVCSKPETCKCFAGYRLDDELSDCRPVCENGCENGDCILPNFCVCKNGYHRDANGICEPICLENCKSDLEYCAKPGVCQCIHGYKKGPPTVEGSSPCEPICDRECINSDCVKPNTCQCYNGYEHLDDDLFTCEPKCNRGCKNGQCTRPNTCTCLTGYKLETNNSHICEPICTSECVNGKCIAPEICSCFDGYVPQGEEKTNICQPYCSNSCTHGRCLSPEKCTCDDGYELRSNASSCEPICTESCIMGNCTFPNTCTCLENHRFREGSKFVCEPFCNNECINGRCTGPNECTCNDGYEKKNFTDDNFECIAVCKCENGYCNETSSICATCVDGYDLISTNTSTICTPHCEGDCTNGRCIGPQTCLCNESYDFNNDSQGNPTCTHACGMECVHGICLKESGICSCAYGWSGKYCDEPLLCSITVLENEPMYLQLNESIGYDELENMTITEKSWPICNNRCSKEINNTTKCVKELDEESSNITCLMNFNLQCNMFSHFHTDVQNAGVNIVIVAIACIITLFVLIMSIYGIFFVRKSNKLYTESIDSVRGIHDYDDNSLIENETSSINL